MRTILLLLVLAFATQADDIVNLNVQSTWDNSLIGSTQVVNFTETWDITKGLSHFDYGQFGGGAFNFQIINTPDINGVQFYDTAGDGYQILANAYGDSGNPDPRFGDTVFGTVGTYTHAELDIYCHAQLFPASAPNDTACTNFMDGGPFLDGQPTTQSIVITPATSLGCDPNANPERGGCNPHGPIQNTPEMSSGASLAAGLLLSSAFILYNGRRKANLDAAI